MAAGEDAWAGRCAVSTTMQVIGERWTMKVLREMFHGFTHFEDFATRTGAPRDILTARLRKLEAQGILERRLYNERPKRYSYHLTRPGMALGNVMLAMMSWGRDYGDWDETDPLVWSHDCGAPVSVGLFCRECGEPVARRMTAPAGLSAEDVEPAHL